MRWLRRAEITLGVIGILLLGGALAAVLRSSVYQARQERAFSALERKTGAPATGGGSPSAAAPAARPARLFDADPLVLGRIEIPRIGASAIVREGDDDATLAVAVGHIPGTARPGRTGNMALAGHRDSFFRALRNIRVDDTIRFRTVSGLFEYRVDSTEVVGPRDVRVLASTGGSTLTLVTCYPFRFLGRAPKRFIVHARLSLLGPAPP